MTELEEKISADSDFLERGQKAAFGEVEINSDVRRILEARGITNFYKHQAEGIERIRAGENVVVSAPTASGKTEIYLVPVVEAALEGKNSLLLYPTKALSRDQLERFREFALLGARAEVYDGDTPQQARARIRADKPQILISNVDMLHFMLMNARLFDWFFSKLKYVVVDEIHIYSGVLGAHLSNISRRLHRILLKNKNTDVQFVCCSATVGNALAFAEQIFERKFSLVDARWAPKSKTHHYIVNSLKRGESYTTTSLKLARALLLDKEKVLVFGNSHSVVERLGMIAKEEGILLKVYRSGLGGDARRRLEHEFKKGDVRALAATSALELGMDIGSVDAVVLAGFPGTLTRVRQRIGRAGRKGQEATAVFVARENPLDQYYAENTNEYLKGEPENCYANPSNEHVLRLQILAMARDHPVDSDEIGEIEGARAVLEFLLREGFLRDFSGVFIPTRKGLALLRASGVRGSAEPVKIFDAESGKFLGEREETMALCELFPGALYLHGGEQYVSESLDVENKAARVLKLLRPTAEYTVALREKTAELIDVFDERASLSGRLSLASVHITDEIYGYVKRDYLRDVQVSRKIFGEPYLHSFDTHAIFFDFPARVVSLVDNFGDGLHALEHVSIAMMPALTGADTAEIGGISYPSGRMYIYDGVPGGAGLARIIYEKFERILEMARERLEKCECRSGCPSCVLDPMCGNANRNLSKKAAREIAKLLH
ncbi:MAG: DEAD/DEAH box helicase [Candidatus Micrarchaeota archaeon]